MPKRTYTETEKLGTMMLALDAGVVVASEQMNTPETTIYKWFNESGGITKVRSVAEEAMLNARLAAHRAVYKQVALKVGTIQDAELFTTYREMLRTTAEKEATTQTAQAGAQATLQVVIQSKDGEPEVIEVPRE